MDLEFLENGPAVVISGDERVLVIADLHFGIESDLDRHGIHVPSRSEERLERVMTCVGSARPDLLLLLGDVKHTVPGTTRQEFRELPGILDALRSETVVRVIPGNHDPGIARFLDDRELLPAAGTVIDGVAYLHGHAAPTAEAIGRLVVAGHHHPVASLRDSVGCSLRAPAYLLGEVDEQALGIGRNDQSGQGDTRVLLIPAFNEYAGYDLLLTMKKPFSPLSRCIRKESAEVFLADGTYVCRLEELVPDERDAGT
jgi:metallophosphoesterase superfamily enzyme